MVPCHLPLNGGDFDDGKIMKPVWGGGGSRLVVFSGWLKGKQKEI